MHEINKKLELIVKEMEATYGKAKARDILQSTIQKLNPPVSDNTLTIVSDKGIHHLPETLKRGELYYAAEGLDLSELSSVENKYREVLWNLSQKLKSKQWKKVYLVPFGHNTLCMQIKLLVFRITRLETIDVLYNNGSYIDLSIYQRDIILDKKPPSDLVKTNK